MNSGRSHLWLWICEMFNCDLVVIACNNFHFGCIRCVADPSISVFKSSKWKENEWRFSIHKSKCRAILETTVSRQKWTNCIQKLNNNEAHNIDWSFFFFRWRCSPLWALACRTMSLHFVLSVTSPLHLLTAITWRSLSTPSLHPFLDLPFRLVSSSSWVNIFLGILSSSILSRWPSQLILCPFIHFTIFSSLLNYSSSRFVLLFHSPSSFLGPYILLNIFLSKISRASSSFFVIVHVSAPYFTTGLIYRLIHLTLFYLSLVSYTEFISLRTFRNCFFFFKKQEERK